MGRLIDADALIDEMVKIPGNRWNTKTFGEALDRIPTIDAIPVDWMTKRMNETATLVKEADRINHWHCSKCGTGIWGFRQDV